MGRVARSTPRTNRNRFRLIWLGLVAAVLLSTGLPVLSQSGRNPKPGKKPGVGPVERPGSPSSPSTPSRKSTDEIDEHDIVRISSNLVPIPVSVIDRRGNAIVNLKLEDFELRVDGQVRALADLTRSETSVKLAMLFDNSGSLDAAREFEKQAAIRFFRKVMRSKDEAAIYSIETDSYLAQTLTSDVLRLQHTIAMFARPEGGTSLFDAIVSASTYLRPYTGRRVLVIVSDGIETTSRHTDFDLVVQRVLADDCQVYVVQTGLYEGANLRALAAERRMERITSQTGGAVYLPKTTAQLDTAFDQIAADLAHQYVLSYYPPVDQHDGRMHVLDLSVKTRTDVRVRSRTGYLAPKPAASAGW
jgi:Ca-activated chloride channel family protein